MTNHHSARQPAVLALWAHLGKTVASLWPSSRWEPGSIDELQRMLAPDDGITESLALEVVRGMAKEGREKSPAPGQLYRACLALLASRRTYLPPSTLAEPTDGERSRTRERLAAIRREQGWDSADPEVSC